ncbi:uncharacterized protein LOC127136691 [Lathyrus oleraceus]|uniref:uncharacterized protein LOC127136691 n=1 Tax=Pisum sativum TaxID=3888 RepID=UPI0021D129C3|nr:uncharacterized protein LOC127136691 [Pisum sativum]
MINAQSAPEEKEKLVKWERSIQLSLYAIKRTISEHMINVLLEKYNSKQYLIAIGERFQVSDNVESGCLMKQLTYMKYDNNGGVREFILQMVYVQTKLKSHDIDLNENLIVSHALNYLLVEFTQIKIAYNTFGEKWTVNNLITKCVAEEEKLKKERSDLGLLTIHAKLHSGKSSWKNKKNTHSASHRHPEFREPNNG